MAQYKLVVTTSGACVCRERRLLVRDQGGGLRVRAEAATAIQSSGCECEKDNAACVCTENTSGACESNNASGTSAPDTASRAA